MANFDLKKYPSNENQTILNHVSKFFRWSHQHVSNLLRHMIPKSEPEISLLLNMVDV
jgi:hypothetical protein